MTPQFTVLLISLICITYSSALSDGMPTTPTTTQGSRPRIPVLRYEDDWVCVNKPEGLTVHANSRNRHQVTLKSMLKRQLARKVYPVHRLDHRTSGAILFAFDPETCGIVHDRLKKGQKDYVALLRGEWRYDTEQVVMDEPLRSSSSGDTSNDDGVLQDARTTFSLLATSLYREMPCSLVMCQPETGRTHQIRRHAARMSHPVLGDSQHGDSRINRLWRTERGLDRLALHCLSIRLHNDEIPCTAPLMPSFRRVLEEDDRLWQTITSQDPRFLLDPVDERSGTFGRNYRTK